jgi:hypothetical protein
MSLVLYVGNNDESVAIEAKNRDQFAYLIDHSNYTQEHTGTCYTSIADLPGLTEFAELLRRSNEIVYVTPQSQWSDYLTNQKNQKSAKEWTEHYLKTFALDPEKKIVNGPTHDTTIPIIADLCDNRKDSNRQLWVAGCSVTHGIGVEDNQRYPRLIADQLKLPVSILSQSGSSISWAADQLLRSDIRSGDIVIWGLTIIERFPEYNESTNTVIQVNVNNSTDVITTKFLCSQTLSYISMTSILQVINFCDKVNAKLILAGVLFPPELGSYLNKHYENYVHLNGFFGVDLDQLFLDVGTDSRHPGQETHRWYATKILERLNLLQDN